MYAFFFQKNCLYVNEKSVDKIRNVDTFDKICRQLGYMEDTNLTSIRAHMSPDLNLLYCRVNKCASTMTLELLKQLYECDTDCLLQVAERVRLQENAREIMDNAFSFMVVREPYGRLFSTYCNIFYFPKEDWLYRGTKIIKLARSSISNDSFTYGHDLTFAELIKYTVDTYEQGNRLDEHVRPMHHRSCNPCVFKFDFIAHLETLQNDIDVIFNQFPNKNIDKKPIDIMVSLKNWTTMGPLKHLFKTISLLKGSNISLYDIYLRAWCYYQINGHVLKTMDFPYDRNDGFNITHNDFVQKLTSAMEASLMYKTKLKEQKNEAIMQAYSTISNEYMERLSKVVQGDCLLFGYEEKPPYLFNRTSIFSYRPKFNYFKGLLVLTYVE